MWFIFKISTGWGWWSENMGWVDKNMFLDGQKLDCKPTYRPASTMSHSLIAQEWFYWLIISFANKNISTPITLTFVLKTGARTCITIFFMWSDPPDLGYLIIANRKSCNYPALAINILLLLFTFTTMYRLFRLLRCLRGLISQSEWLIWQLLRIHRATILQSREEILGAEKQH